MSNFKKPATSKQDFPSLKRVDDPKRYRLFNHRNTDFQDDTVVILKPLEMEIPNSYGIYSPSKILLNKEISYREFTDKFADYPKRIRFCGDDCALPNTLLENSEWVTAYGFGLDCWYLVEVCDIDG